MIYLDNSATTRISEAALARYCEVSRDLFGNPSSLHAVGKAAEDVLRDAREAVRAAIGAKGGTVVFTASGTEANNLAILGRGRAKARYKSAHILTTAGEHASVAAPMAALAEGGMKLAEIPTVGGRLDLDALDALLTPDTVLVSAMLVNNETGAHYDMRALADRLRGLSDCALHADATQALFKVPVDVRALGVRMLTISSHKVEGPKGVGALWLDDSLMKEKGVAPQILGGGQESGMRSGTENVPAIAAFATALREGTRDAAARMAAMLEVREYLLGRLTSDAALGEVKPVLPEVAAPHILTLVLPAVKSEVMLHHISSVGISVSSGSACSSHGHVGHGALPSFGLSQKESDSAIRVSISHHTTREDIDALCAALGVGLSRLARRR